MIYKGHPGLEQKRLWLLPYITYESEEHIFLMIWSSIFLVLWVLGTPVLMALFIWKDGRALPSYLRGASTRFLKAHYRYVWRVVDDYLFKSYLSTFLHSESPCL